MTKRRDLGRRDFLKTTGVGAVALGASSLARSVLAEPRAANEKLNIACIGTANRAAANVRAVSGENLVAFCDPDSNYLERTLSQFPQARGYADYRELFDKEAGKIDAVVVATPDHHHAPATLRALRAGMHVYCEKPMSHTVEEARAMATEAAKQGVATQMGIQIHAYDNYHRVVEVIQSGAIGDVTDVHVWVGKNWGGDERPAAAQQPPKNLNWDAWLGPAPERPFAAGRYHPAQWRRWWDFGSGTLGDMGCHYMDLPFWALDLKHPTSCEAEGPTVHAETCPVGLIARYEFPERAGKPPVKLTWYDAQRIPRAIEGQRVPGSGVMFVGSEGMMFADYTNYRLFPQEKFAGYKPPTQTIPHSIGHHAEWIRACKEGTPTTCNFSYAGALTETVLLGTVAYRTGKKLEWDAQRLVATSAPEATQFIRKTYREGWEL